MELAKLKACICEGGAERAIIDILLDNDLLIFQRNELLDETVLHCRSGKEFESKYLRKGSVLSILPIHKHCFLQLKCIVKYQKVGRASIHCWIY